MDMGLVEYRSLVFDCDGVVLDSNKVKTVAFYKAALPYGEQAAEALVMYHKANGGVSRYKKFSYFLKALVPLYAAKENGPDLEQLLETYAAEVVQGLLTCDIAPGLRQLREATSESRWVIVSGGDQAELRQVFSQRGLSDWFDGGIFGSPDTKEQILNREIASGNIQRKALFLGDSKYDYQASSAAGLDFIFLYGWTEVEGWKSWVELNKIKAEIGIKYLIP